MVLGIGGPRLVAVVMRLFGYSGTRNIMPTTILAIVIVTLMRKFWSSPAK